MTEPIIRFQPLAPDVAVPERATRGSAGYDVRAFLTHGSVRVWSAAATSPAERMPAVQVEDDDSRAGAVERDGVIRVTLDPGDRALIPTGFRARLPEGYEGQIRIRSSLAWKRGLIVPNSPGTVDSDYPDEWFVLVLNASRRPQPIIHGERVAQIVLQRYQVAEWREAAVGVSTDRVGGLGSTGPR